MSALGRSLLGQGPPGGSGLTSLSSLGDSISAQDPRRRMELAAVYIKDAVHGREPNLRILENDRVWGRTPLEVYAFVHRKRWRIFVLVAVYLNLALALFEAPTELGDNFPTVVITEIACLLVIAVDAALRAYSHDREWPSTSNWVLVKYILLVGSFAEVAVVVLLHSLRIDYFRVVRMFRPLFLLERGRVMRKMAAGILQSIPKVLDVCVLLSLHVLFFGFAGFILFSGKPGALGMGQNGQNDNFESLEDSFLNLFILLTTANYPDVQISSYSHNNWTVIYFILFLLFGLYFLSNIILAVVYNNFQELTKGICQNQIRAQTRALCLSFDQLAVDRNDLLAAGDKVRAPSADDGGAPPAERGRTASVAVQGARQRYVTWETWLRIMRVMRPDVPERHLLVIFYALDSDRAGVLDLSKWRRLCDYIDVRISRDVPIPSEEALQAAISSSFLLGWQRMRRALRVAIEYKWTERVLNLVVAASALLIARELQGGHGTEGGSNTVNNVFLFVFVVEVVGKMTAYGPLRYLASGFNRLDFVITMVGFVGLVFNQQALRQFVLFRVLRLVRLMRTLKRYRPVFVTSARVVPALAGLFGVLISLFYFFAIVGMEIFGGVITRDKEPELEAALSRGTWIQNNYWEMNFNDLSHAMVTLFALMVVNNFFIIMNGYAHVTSRWARLYFVIFYFVCVLVVANVIVSFVIDSFLSQYEVVQSGEEVEYQIVVRKIGRAVHAVLTGGGDGGGGGGGGRGGGEDASQAKRPASTRSSVLDLLDPEEVRSIASMRHNVNKMSTAAAGPSDVDGSGDFGPDNFLSTEWEITRARRSVHLYRDMFEDVDADRLYPIETAWDDLQAVFARLVEQRERSRTLSTFGSSRRPIPSPWDQPAAADDAAADGGGGAGSIN